MKKSTATNSVSLTIPTLIAGTIIVIALAGISGYAMGRRSTDSIPYPTPPTEKGCTLDAKLCPDGSSVGRVSPSCDFAPCPGEKQNITVTPPVSNDIVCTMDAKMCPDGSYVGRIPPSCEFAACPGQ